MSYMYVSLMFCFVCPARARPHPNEAKVTKNILRIGQNEAKHKSLMFFAVQQTNLIGQLGGYCNCTNETPHGKFSCTPARRKSELYFNRNYFFNFSSHNFDRIFSVDHFHQLSLSHCTTVGHEIQFPAKCSTGFLILEKARLIYKR